MALKYDFSALWYIAEQLGADRQNITIEPKITESRLVTQVENEPTEKKPFFSGIEGLVIGDGPNQIKVNAAGEFRIESEPVFIYIYDHSFNFHQVIAGEKEGNKIHVYNCQLIQRMIKRRPEQRYIAMSKRSDKYPIGAVIDGVVLEGLCSLQICGSCLKERNRDAEFNS
ncbi:hypothetical protein [Thorsellia anophelis]|uniref:Uncharacterized protein n=1 Tax=Thorsellia anophelis DSM 18579 TaxID=1123402 RepID=A0A1I0D2I6_9GAMM|nr:hypothetical protein [Thorsellia anophelis]SET25981.1 hypothetical protein SAMN02583745_01821 [Thorsellia anophelis DSM 18579]